MEKTTIAATMAVLVAILMVGSVLVPIIDIQSKETTTITNEGAGDIRYAYYDAPAAYTHTGSYDDVNDEVSFGVQSTAATDMICWASDIGSIIYSDGTFTLLYDDNGTMTAVDLGANYIISGHSSGGVGIVSTNVVTPLELEGNTWAYTPDANGVFGFFTDSGKTVKDFPVATWGGFAGAYAYNEINSLNYDALVPTYSVSDGVFTPGDWEPETNDNVISAGYVSGDAEVIKSNANVDPSTGTLVGDLYYTFSGTDATVVGISSSLSTATSITIPDTVTYSDTTYNVTAIYSAFSSSAAVFSNLTTLESVTFSSNLTTIGNSAFYGCTSLALTSLPDGLTTIGSSAFQGCTSLALTSLPDGLTTIGTHTFNGCTSLALTSLPDGLTTIGSNAFYGCTSLALTSLPDGLTTIDANTFRECTNLALTSLPDGLTMISSNAFQGCTSLALTTLPDGLTSIKSNAFNGCTSLVNLIIMGSPTIGTNAFVSTNIAEILNLGSTEITAGSYGLSADVVVDDAITNSGYIAPVSLSETVEKSGAEYDLMRMLPVMVIAGIVMASAVMFGLMRRND